MISLNRHPVKKGWSVFLAVVLFIGDIYLLGAVARRQDGSNGSKQPGEGAVEVSGLEYLLRWAILGYEDGMYREVMMYLRSMLPFLEEQDEKDKVQVNKLKSEVYILLGAIFEQVGNTRDAQHYYRLAVEINENPGIEGLNLDSLVEYQRIVLNRAHPIRHGMIEKPLVKPVKRRSLLPWIIAGTVITGVVVLLLLKKDKQSHDTEIDPEFDVQTLGIVWSAIPPSEFMMGDNFNEGDADERPVHPVELGLYYISITEITYDQYLRFCHATGRNLPGYTGWEGRCPVVNVTWGDANAFCQWVSARTGKAIQLPTEAQWEQAARGEDQRRYPWGNTPPTCDLVNWGCNGRPLIVGINSNGMSSHGIFDMAGNVAEWCLDQYSEDFYSISPLYHPLNRGTGIGQSARYVIRGGSWDSTEVLGIRSSDRWYGYCDSDGSNTVPINYRSTTVGFRVVWVIN